MAHLPIALLDNKKICPPQHNLSTIMNLNCGTSRSTTFQPLIGSLVDQPPCLLFHFSVFLFSQFFVPFLQSSLCELLVDECQKKEHFSIKK